MYRIPVVVVTSDIKVDDWTAVLYNNLQHVHANVLQKLPYDDKDLPEGNNDDEACDDEDDNDDGDDPPPDDTLPYDPLPDRHQGAATASAAPGFGGAQGELLRFCWKYCKLKLEEGPDSNQACKHSHAPHA